MPPAGFSEMPPVSKQTPLPISATGFCAFGPVHPAHDQELRFARTALADGQQHVHAELLHLGLAQDLDLDAELGELAGAAGEFDRIEHVGGLAHQVAGEEYRVDGGLEPLIGAARLGRAGHHDRELLERVLLLGLVLGLVLVEAVVAQLRAERDAGGDLAGRQPAALHGIDDDGHGLLARRIGLGRDDAAERLRGAGIEFARLADAQQASGGRCRRTGPARSATGPWRR